MIKKDELTSSSRSRNLEGGGNIRDVKLELKFFHLKSSFLF